MGIGIWQIIIVAVIVLVLFGRGKISDVMGDVAKGIKQFRRGVQEGEDEDSNSASKQNNMNLK